MKKIKNSTIFAIILTILVIGIHTNIHAAGMGMSINKSSAYVGDSFSITISGINGKVSISGNSNVSLSTSGTKWVEGSMTITGTAKSVGTGTITVTPIDASTTGADPVEVTKALSKSITIKEKVVETPPAKTTTSTTATSKNTTNTTNNTKTTTKTKVEAKVEDNFYISAITLKGIKEDGEQVEIGISPEFNKDTYEYTCNIAADIQKIDLQKDAGDYTNSIVVTGLDELIEGENTIKLLLAAEDHESKTYTIKVIKEAKEVIENEPEQEQEENTDNNKEKAETKMISMPVYLFIIMQIIIIVVEVIVIYFIPWKKIIKK